MAKIQIDEKYARVKARSLLMQGMSFSYILKDITADIGNTSLAHVIIQEENEKLIRKGIETSLMR